VHKTIRSREAINPSGTRETTCGVVCPGLDCLVHGSTYQDGQELEHRRQEERLIKLSWFIPEKRTQRGNLVAIYYYLTRKCREDGDRLLLDMHRERARGN